MTRSYKPYPKTSTAAGTKAGDGRKISVGFAADDFHQLQRVALSQSRSIAAQIRFYALEGLKREPQEPEPVHEAVE